MECPGEIQGCSHGNENPLCAWPTGLTPWREVSITHIEE